MKILASIATIPICYFWYRYCLKHTNNDIRSSAPSLLIIIIMFIPWFNMVWGLLMSFICLRLPKNALYKFFRIKE